METALWSVAAAITIATILRGIPWVTRRAVRDVVNDTIQPLAAKLEEHMEREERARAELNVKLAEIKGEFHRNAVEHASFDGRLSRLERG